VTALLLAALLGASSSGCSLALVTRPPDGPIEPTARLDCTPPTTPVPGSDVIGGYLAVAAGVVVAVLGITGGPGCQRDGTCASTTTTRKQLGLGLGLMALGYAAMRSGGAAAEWVTDCQALERDQRSCLAGSPLACARLSDRPGSEALPAAPAARSSPGTPGFSIGESCATDAECQAGLACQYGRCAAAPAR
jgi:hypothetical protein